MYAPNYHQVGQKISFVLPGKEPAICSRCLVDIQAGDGLPLKPGITHTFMAHAGEHTGPRRLRCLTMPDNTGPPRI